MKTHRLLAMTSAALLLGLVLPAQSLEVKVGNVGVTATTGGSNVAAVRTTTNANGGSGGTNLDIIASNADGSLVDVDSEGNTTTGNINLGGAGLAGLDGVGGGAGGTGLDDVEIDLGGLLPGGIDGIGGPGTGGDGDGSGVLTPTQVTASFDALTGSDQAALKIRCRSVIERPAAFDPSTLALCRLILRVPQ